MPEIVIDYEDLQDVRRGFDRSSDTLDRIAPQAPRDGDYGAAGVILTRVLAAHLEAAGMLAAECEVLSAAVGLCVADAEVVDATQAVDLLSVGAE